VVPHIYVDGAAGAVRFYIEAFGVEELFRRGLSMPFYYAIVDVDTNGYGRQGGSGPTRMART
jgi:hypothetical protein